MLTRIQRCFSLFAYTVKIGDYGPSGVDGINMRRYHEKTGRTSHLALDVGRGQIHICMPTSATVTSRHQTCHETRVRVNDTDHTVVARLSPARANAFEIRPPILPTVKFITTQGTGQPGRRHRQPGCCKYLWNYSAEITMEVEASSLIASKIKHASLHLDVVHVKIGDVIQVEMTSKLVEVFSVRLWADIRLLRE